MSNWLRRKQENGGWTPHFSAGMGSNIGHKCAEYMPNILSFLGNKVANKFTWRFQLGIGRQLPHEIY